MYITNTKSVAERAELIKRAVDASSETSLLSHKQVIKKA